MTAASGFPTASAALEEGALSPPGLTQEAAVALIEQMRAEQQTPPGAKLAVGVAQEFVQSKPTSSHHHASLLKSFPYKDTTRRPT